jgi:hypothetical protein
MPNGPANDHFCRGGASWADAVCTAVAASDAASAKAVMMR